MPDSSTSNHAKKIARERSPSFPFIPLEMAITRLEEFERIFSRQDPPANRTYLAWEFKSDTSQAQQTLAALKAFGMVDYKGLGPKRPVALTAEARTYLRAQQETVKREILKGLALKPKWIAHFWDSWGDQRVPDPIRLDALVLEHKFNHKAAPTFLKVYDETIAFSGLAGSDKICPASNSEDDDKLPVVKVGDFVRWTSGGVDQFLSARVISISEDGEWLWVEGDSKEAIPMNEVQLVTPPASGTPPPTPPEVIAAQEAARAAQEKPGIKEEKFDTDEGVLRIEFPENLSAASVAELDDFFQLFMRRARRRAGVPEPKKGDVK